MKITEQSDRWAVTGCDAVESLRFDWAVTVVIGTGDDRFEIRIENRFTLLDTAGARWELDPEGDPSELAPVLRVIRKPTARLDAFKAGHLELEFGDGSLLAVPSSEEYEPWGIVGERGLRIVSTPGNGLAVWT